jgi:predicted nucleotidyltransferase
MGRKIDLVTKKSLRNIVLIQEIEQTKVELYAA